MLATLALGASAAEYARVAQCDDQQCTMTRDMFFKVMSALEYWYDRAHEPRQCI